VGELLRVRRVRVGGRQGFHAVPIQCGHLAGLSRQAAAKGAAVSRLGDVTHDMLEERRRVFVRGQLQHRRR
jgi:hypothetical protein